MKKRSTRKKVKKAFFLSLSFLVILLIGVLVFLFLRDFSFSFPRFRGDNNGQILNPNATYSIQDIRNALADAKIRYSTVTISSSSGALRADLVEGTLVYFSYEKEVDWQISSLQSILLRLTIEN